MRRPRASCALLALLFLTLLDSSACLETVVRPEAGLTVTVASKSPEPDPQCTVCKTSVDASEPLVYTTSVTVGPEEEAKLIFNCSDSIEQSYTVTIAQTIECTTDACTPSAVKPQLSLLPELPRTFTWAFTIPQEEAPLSLDFKNGGLVKTSEPCADGFQYAVQPHGQYCSGGTQTVFEVTNGASVSLQVPPNAQLEKVLFQLGRTMVVSVNSLTTVVLSRDPKGPECEVCSVKDLTSDCSPTEKTLPQVENLSLMFGCLKPKDIYSVKINKKIECTQSSCTPLFGDVEPKVFKDFKRSLTWDITVPERTVLSLNFPGDGLTEMSGEETCPDGYKYSVKTTKSDGAIQTKSYCHKGTVSHLKLKGATTVILEAPKDGGLIEPAFSVKAAQAAKRMMSVTPELDTSIFINRVIKDADCDVCVIKESKPECKATLMLRDPRNTSVEFTCSQPQDVFNVEISRDIDCTEISCSSDIVQAESSLFPDFNRTFAWYLKVSSTRAFQLDLPEPGMRQIPNEDMCPDGHTYSLLTYLRTGPATIGTFCKGGTVTSVAARYRGRVSLMVPGDVKMNPVEVKLKNGPETSVAAIVKVNLPRGVSETEFITAKYPQDFPNNEQMQWDFVVPGMHNYSVQFLDHMAPECLSGDVEVEYQKEGKKATMLTLTDPQPQHQQGNFNMVLKNCDTNTTLDGLALKYKVSVMRSGHPVLCTVDLTKHKGVSVQIEKVGSDPYCEMSIDSKLQEKINVAAGSKASLSFLDCPHEDLRLTASKVIACKNLASCMATTLTVPTLDSCLRMPLHSFTWHIQIPKDATIDLTSPTGSLQRSLPEQPCNNSVSLHVTEGDGSSLGDFCYNGVIKKIQVHDNVSVTATAPDLGKTKRNYLRVNFSEEIPETIIYRVSPTTSSPTLLATPNWPQGMSPSSTVSWIVTVPSQYQSQLQFNVSQPKCKDRHTSMKVKMLGQEEEIMSRREDEEAEDKLLVSQSFYLNMSNCVPEEGRFGALTKIVLEKKSHLLAIVLGIAGALLLALAVLAAVCIITKKKKKDKMRAEASIYMGKGNIFRPGDNHFTKSRSDNESHVYDSIDDTMVYGHLLGGGSGSYADSMQDSFKGPQVDSYQTFTGPNGADLPVIKEPEDEPEMDQYNTFLNPSDSFLPPRPRTPIGRQDSLGFEDRRMVDNVLYTFKSTGDINNIRLSGVDLEPEPPLTDEETL